MGRQGQAIRPKHYYLTDLVALPVALYLQLFRLLSASSFKRAALFCAFYWQHNGECTESEGGFL